MKTKLALVLGLLACSCHAQDKPVEVLKPKPHTIDKAFLLVNGLSLLSTVADVENTHYSLVHDYHVQEANPIFFSRRPSRARMYGVEAVLFVPQTLLSYKWKREDDADRAAGRQLAKYRWYAIPLINVATHSIGITITLASTGR